MDHLFVYGSLREGSGHPMGAVLAAAGTREGPARVRGRLYAVSWYPGLVLDPEGDATVVGELWRLHAPDVLPELDDYEGCGASDAEPFEFRRTRVSVEFEGATVEAWTYTYEGAVDEMRRVASGDWLA